MDLVHKRCLPCEGGVPALDAAAIERLLCQVPGWAVAEGKLQRTFFFANFVEAMAFLNRVAELAEREGHHPDFSVHYRRVEMQIWTHAVGGLTENDFILAAHIEPLVAA
ncbi:4a-hydroxytetrahydrobiopterin dehydratase [Vulgatibacter sp.]|uniref:4a-hydroxytetrahydrobiopterin dehydratase n=1 Tax=Vulgatibacter sp. TaxID=1971226 RepID=UPI003568B88F